MAATLYLLCGKIAAGKSTLARQLAERHGALLIGEDQWTATLFADELKTIDDYARVSARLRAAMGPHVAAILRLGLSVVLDFPANTVKARAWMRGIAAEAGVPHELHWLDVADDVCLARLARRNACGDHAFQVDTNTFAQFTRYFVPPAPDEGFTLIRHPA